MNRDAPLVCDGCGLPASARHIAQRLKRLEWATRYRPVHIATLFLGGVSPSRDVEYLYRGAGEEGQGGEPGKYEGEAEWILEATGIVQGGSGDTRSMDAMLGEFQHRGYFLTHVLECPENELSSQDFSLKDAMERKMSSVFTRIRRSLKPRRVVLISRALDPFVQRFAAAELGASALLDGGKPFEMDGPLAAEAARRLANALPIAAAAR